MREEKKEQELQICSLTKAETDNPYLILREFVEDVSLAAIRNMIVTMRDICITTENVFYGDHTSREDLLYVTQKMIRFFEAAYIQLKKDIAPAGKIIQGHFEANEQYADLYSVRVTERTFFKRSKSGPASFPCITLMGKWLAVAGFHPGDEITIASKFQTLLITMSREWDQTSNEFKLRA